MEGRATRSVRCVRDGVSLTGQSQKRFNAEILYKWLDVQVPFNFPRLPTTINLIG